MTKIAVIAGNSSEDLAKKIAKKIHAQFVKTELKLFPDGESKITLKKIPKVEHVIVVQSTYPPVDTNLIQALSLISHSQQFSKKITLIIPYMGYARQDREFLPGEIITMRVLAKLFKAVGVTNLIVVDIHSLIGLKHFEIKKQNVSAIPDLAMYFKKLKLKDVLVVSPDQGGKDRAKKFAENLKVEYIALSKKRDRKTGKVQIINSKLNHVVGRDLILVDDMISTGGSIIKAAEFLRKQKCRKIYVACTHALLINDAETRIKKAGVTQIISTNTIPGNTSIVDISNTIAKAMV